MKVIMFDSGISQPKDKGIILADILEEEADIKYKMSDTKIDRVLNAKRGKGFFYTKESEKIGTLISGYAKQPTDGVYVDLEFKRKLTPLECERLQTVPEKVFYGTLDLKELLCLDQAKNFVNVVEKNHKLLKLVSSVEKKELKEYVNNVVINMSVNHQSIKCIVPKSVSIQIPTQTKKCTKTKETEKCTSADNAKNNVLFRYHEKEVNSATENVHINLTEGRITHNEKVESLLKDNNYHNQKNGNIVQRLSLLEIMGLVESVDSEIEKEKEKNFIYTTSYHLSTKNIEQILTILYYFAKNAIGGYTAQRTKIKSLFLSLTNGYTSSVSNSQRYKMLGNGFTVDVIVHILNNIKGGLKDESMLPK